MRVEGSSQAPLLLLLLRLCLFLELPPVGASAEGCTAGWVGVRSPTEPTPRARLELAGVPDWDGD